MNSKVKMYNSAELDSVLTSISPEEQERIDNRMLLAAKIYDAIKAKGWKKKDFMIAMGQKNQSVISKWLSGTHNFTTDTLTDIGRVLGINMLNLESKPIIKSKTYTIIIKQEIEDSEYNNIISQPDLMSRQTKRILLHQPSNVNSIIAEA